MRIDLAATRYAEGCDVALDEELDWFAKACRAPKMRTLSDFAEQEIVIPTGRFAGRRFRRDRQPAIGIYYDLVQSGNWTETAVTGPTQTGKSLGALVIPVLFHLFEVGETVVLGIPDKDMAADKYREDFKPVIERTRYHTLMPKTGAGSRGGKAIDAIQFGNGATLKFMSGGGGDEERAGFTTRVVAVTEADKLDEVSLASREGRKIDQIKARTSHYDTHARIYTECTTTIEEGYIWSQYKAGTATQLYMPCPHCAEWITLERENLVGWQDVESEGEAAAAAAWVCLRCGETISETERTAMNRAAKPVHRGQEIDNQTGAVIGPLPPTKILGFRWSAGNNLFVTAGTLGAEEWKAKNAPEIQREELEKALKQYRWVMPYAPPVLDATPLDPKVLSKRTREAWREGMLMEEPDAFTFHIDVGKWLLHWMACAWWQDGSGHLVAYGRREVPSKDLGPERGVLAALRELRDDVILKGWPSATGKIYVPQLVGTDARWGDTNPAVYEFCRESGPSKFVATLGYGVGQQRMSPYIKPKKKSTVVRGLYEHFHMTRIEQGIFCFHVDSDFWKTYAHEGLALPDNKPGRFTFYHTESRDRDRSHQTLINHLTAEKKVSEFVAGKGTITRWQVERQANHWLDTYYNSCTLGAYLGCSRLPPPDPAQTPPHNPLAPPVVMSADAYFNSRRR